MIKTQNIDHLLGLSPTQLVRLIAGMEAELEATLSRQEYQDRQLQRAWDRANELEARIRRIARARKIRKRI
jgi:hypothetical protein